jgi:hypothetical protein
MCLGKFQPAKVGIFQPAETGEYSTGVDSVYAIPAQLGCLKVYQWPVLLYRPFGLSEHKDDFGVSWEGLFSLRVSHKREGDGQKSKCRATAG